MKKFIDKLQQAWNKLLYKLMFKKYKLNEKSNYNLVFITMFNS